MSTLETQYREYLRNNRGGFCSFEEWKEIHGNQIKQALIDIMKSDEELGLYDDIRSNRKELICKDCSDSLEDCTCIEDTVDFPKQEPKKVLTEEDIFNQKDIDAVTDYINKEQQKQHLIDMMESDEELGLYEQINQNNPVTKGSTALVKEIKLKDVFNDEKKENIKKFIDEINNSSEPNQALKDAVERYYDQMDKEVHQNKSNLNQ